MAEQHRKPSLTGEHIKDPSNEIMGDEEGVDGEIDEIEEADMSSGIDGKTNFGEVSASAIRDVSGKDGKDSRKHGGPERERRRHHRHHHSSGHRDRRQRSGTQGDPDTEHHLPEEGARSKRHSESLGRANSEPDKNSRSSHRKDRHHSSHSRHHDQPRSKPNMDDYENGELSDSNEDPMTPASAPRRIDKDKKEHRLPMTGIAEAGEAEDGEILEDGELSDDEAVEGKDEESVNRDVVEVSSTKPPSKEDGKSEKRSRKKSEHKSKRRRDSDDKTRRKKHGDADKMDAENSPAPAWGSGYQGPKPKSSPFHNKQAQYGRGRGYHSPPGLYDSPSYSEDSGDESLPKTLMTEGYIDASVAADEKEGIFNPKLNLGKRKKPPLERNDRKRGRNFEGKSEGPPRKKLLSQAMSERPICKFYMEGKCAKGMGCQFNHDVEKPRKMEVCKYHLTVKGCIKQRCFYMHEDFPCKYYHTGAKCYSGDRCKFSHDPLTEETKRALEMRVAAEDIIDVEELEYDDYDYRPRESHSKPSLLGSPPRFRQDVKKIPSLFEIEVHPPGQSPKPSPQAPNRPSGFYNEANASPKPGVTPNANAPANNPNIGMMNNSAPANQPGLSNQGNMGGPGLLQTPLRPANMIGGPMVNNRPNLVIGMNPQQQRPGGPSQFIGARQMNSNQQGGNLPPVLNMLGAIIREAAMQKGPGGPSGNMNMGPNAGMVPMQKGPGGNMNMGPNTGMVPMLQNMQQGLSMMNSNNMQQGNMNIGPNNIGPNNIGQNIIGPNTIGQNNIGQNVIGSNSNGANNVGNIMLPNSGSNHPSNTNNMVPLQNMMGANGNPGNIVTNNIPGNGADSNMGPNDNPGQSASVNDAVGGRNIGGGQEVELMDVDYRIKPGFMETEEANKELGELDKIRQQLQAQIDEEDEEGPGENEGKVETQGDLCKTDEEQPIPDISDSLQEKDDVKDEKASEKTEVADVEQIEIPADLPKTQRDLFKRIQQQQIIREKERKKQEALKVTEESETKAEDDDWYSSDDDGDEEDKPNLTDILKKLNQPLPAPTVVTPSSASDSFNTSSSGSSITSTFNIIQMINAIKNQTPAKPISDSGGASPAGNYSPPQSSHQKEMLLSSPASPPPVSSSIPSLRLHTLTVDPPVVSAQPTKPLVYSVVKILLNMPKPYTQLPDGVKASDQACRDDPRVKWHLSYLEKLEVKPPQTRDNNSDGEKSQKQSDPRLKKGPSDPRLNKPVDCPNSGQVADPRLQRAAAQSRPADPRLARQMAANLDPRLSRQNSQNNVEGVFLSGPMNNMGAGPMNIMGAGPMNNMGGGPMNSMGGGPMNSMGGGPMNSTGGGPMNSIGGGPPMNIMGGGPPINNMGGGPPMNNMGGGPPMNNMGGGPPMNIMGGGGPMNNMGGGPPVNTMGGGPMNTMGGVMNNQIGSSGNGMGVLMNSPGGPLSHIGSSNLLHGIGSGVNTENQLNLMNPLNNPKGGPGRPFLGSGGPLNNMMGVIGGPVSNMVGAMNQNGGQFNPLLPGANQMVRMGPPHGPGSSLVGSGSPVDGQTSNIRGPLHQQGPVGNDPAMLDPRINNPSGARPGNQRAMNEPPGINDPRLKHRLMDPREQRIFPKDPRSAFRDAHQLTATSPIGDGMGDSGMIPTDSDFRFSQNGSRVLDDFRQSQNYLQPDSSSFQNTEHLKVIQGREERTHNSDHTVEHNESLPSPSSSSSMSSSTQHSDVDKPVCKFDYRNNPRFKRVKRVPGQTRNNMEYNSPLSGEDAQGDANGGPDPGYNSYFNSRPPPSGDPRSRAVSSPTLPDTLQDFDLPDSSAEISAGAEQDLKVKDHFKTIDPTASPFC